MNMLCEQESALVVVILASYDVEKLVFRFVLNDDPNRRDNNKRESTYDDSDVNFSDVLSFAITCKSLFLLYRKPLRRTRIRLMRSHKEAQLRDTALAVLASHHHWSRYPFLFKAGVVRIGFISTQVDCEKYWVLRCSAHSIELVQYKDLRSLMYSASMYSNDTRESLPDNTIYIDNKNAILLQIREKAAAVVFVEPLRIYYSAWEEQTLSDERYYDECSALIDLTNCFNSDFCGNLEQVLQSLNRSGRMRIDEEAYYRKRKRVEEPIVDLDDVDD